MCLTLQVTNVMCHLACVLNGVLSPKLWPKESKPVKCLHLVDRHLKQYHPPNFSKNKLLLRLMNIDIQETKYIFQLLNEQIAEVEVPLKIMKWTLIRRSQDCLKQYRSWKIRLTMLKRNSADLQCFGGCGTEHFWVTVPSFLTYI